MLLVEKNGRPRLSLPGIQTGETVGIHFNVPTGKADQQFRLEGKIARSMDTGIGISFEKGMDEMALACLSDHPGLKQRNQRVLPKKQAKPAKGKVHRRSHRAS